MFSKVGYEYSGNSVRYFSLLGGPLAGVLLFAEARKVAHSGTWAMIVLVMCAVTLGTALNIWPSTHAARPSPSTPMPTPRDTNAPPSCCCPRLLCTSATCPPRVGRQRRAAQTQRGTHTLAIVPTTSCLGQPPSLPALVLCFALPTLPIPLMLGPTRYWAVCLGRQYDPHLFHPPPARGEVSVSGMCFCFRRVLVHPALCFPQAADRGSQPVAGNT